MDRRTFLKVGAGVAAMSPGIVLAKDDFPNRPIRLVVGFPPGGQSDIFARRYAERVSPLLGVPVVIDNKPGASASIANASVARSTPDGYTLSFATSSLILYALLNSKAGYDPVTSFSPIAIVGETPMVIGVNKAKLPVENLEALIREIKANPGKYSAASTGIGAIAHYSLELFKMEAGGLDLVHVPYTGGAAALLGLIRGEVDLFIETLTSMLPYSQESGPLRLLAYCSDKRASYAPAIPTTREAGLPGMLASTFNAVLAPAGTPAAVVGKLADITHDVMSKTAFQDEIRASLIDPIADSNPVSAKDYIASNLEKWRLVTAKAKISLE
ncbi:Bug family tripartite tricarboxylate transporter substrate binding protein [Xanthobacter sp.]|uniref:Bug family tripartite tricarboxylate transporter substrate binding protein n=1 Tax=Xanthobacter sp. TaxID=35809 RepID=UPI0035B37D8E